MLAVATPNASAAELDAATLRGAVAGDATATRALVEMYQVRVFALVSRMLVGLGRATVEDVAQDTFLHVFRKLAMFANDGPARLSTWILTIAARRAIDELRRARPTLVADIDPEDPGRGPDERRTRKDLVVAIERALAALTPPLRAAFLLREYHGLDYADIARALEIDLGTVKSRLARARAELRIQLAEVKP